MGSVTSFRYKIFAISRRMHEVADVVKLATRYRSADISREENTKAIVDVEPYCNRRDFTGIHC